MVTGVQTCALPIFLMNAADVIVADGFVGNVVLKVSEGLVSALGGVIQDTISTGNVITKLGAFLMLPALRKLRNRYTYETYGGAPLLGLRGHCIVTHGRADRTAISNAIRTAADEAGADVIGKIETLIAPHLAREA